MRLSTRLMIGMVLPVFFAAMAIGLIAYHALVVSIYPAQLARMEGDARMMAGRLGGAVHQAASDVAVFAAAPALAELVAARRNGDAAAESLWKARASEVFRTNLANNEWFLQIRFIAAAGGREVVRVERSTTSGVLRVVPDDELQDKSGRPYVRETLNLPAGEIYVSPIELNEEGGRIEVPHVPVVRVASPVVAQDGSTAGIAIINIDLRPSFAELRGSVENGVGVYVVNQAGDYLLHPDPDRAFAFEFGKAARLQDDFPDLADLLRPTDSAFHVSRRVDARSGEESAAAGAVQSLGDSVGVVVLLMAPSSLVLAPAHSVLKSTAMGGAAAIAIAVILAYLLSRTIAQPLSRLTRSVQRFDRGDLIRLPHHAPKEIGLLVGAFRRHIERERLFNAAVQSSTDAVLTLSLEGNITAWNPAAEKLFGYSAEEAVGQPLEMLVPGDRMEEFLELRKNYMRGLPTGPIETMRLAKGGCSVEVSLSVSPVRSLGGEVTGASAIYRDITAQKHSDAMFRLAVDASPAAMIITDQDGRIVLANLEAANVFDRPLEELVGMNVDDLMPDRIRDKHRELRGNFMRNPAKRMMGTGRDLRGLRRDGSEFPLEIALNPINGPDGPMVLSVVVDITERKKAATELERRTEELQRSNAELQQFAFVASHDLQEPLRMVTSFCELLKDRYGESLGEEGREFVDFAVDGARRMRQLINDLLDYSRLQTRVVPFSEVQIKEVLNDALMNLSASIHETEAEVLAGEMPSVVGNPGQLTRLFQNLVGNAIKFTKEERPRIEISAVAERDNWLFTVQDNGIGIDPKQRDAIFGVFQRLHTRDEYPGTGIGLAVCKRIVERHGGRIWVESTPGEGTAMRFTLKSMQSKLAEESITGGLSNQEGSDVRKTG